MSVKVLLDPIYSSKPSHCSSAVKMWKLVDYVLNDMKRDDVFFYWLVPDAMEPEELNWFPKHKNVKLLKFPYHKDRMRAYMTYPKELENAVAFNGELWDYDVLITSRTGIVPLFKISMMSPRDKNKCWVKKVFLFEEMPVMAFKSTVATSDDYVQDLVTLSGYLAADKVCITILHEKSGILRAARRYFTPSHCIELEKKIQVASPAILNEFSIKKEEHRFKRGERPFCLAFCARISPTDNIREVYDTMEKHWIMKGDKGIKLLVTSVSTSSKVPPPKQIDMRHEPREVFWKLVKEDMDCILYFPPEAGFGMALMEPLMFGTPVVVIRAEWSEALLGKDYPFMINSLKDGYGMVKAIHDDYDKYYAQFMEWHEKNLIPMFAEGGSYSVSLYDYLYQGILEHEEEMNTKYPKVFDKKADNDIVQLIAKDAPDEFVMHDRLKELAKTGKFSSLQAKLEDTRDDRGIVWATVWNEYRLALKAFYGFEDAGVTPGHLRRVK